MKEYVISTSRAYTVLLGGKFDADKNTFTITYQSDSASEKDIKKYIASEFKELSHKEIKSVKTRDGWFKDEEENIVGYIDVQFK